MTRRLLSRILWGVAVLLCCISCLTCGFISTPATANGVGGGFFGCGFFLGLAALLIQEDFIG